MNFFIKYLDRGFSKTFDVQSFNRIDLYRLVTIAVVDSHINEHGFSLSLSERILFTHPNRIIICIRSIYNLLIDKQKTKGLASLQSLLRSIHVCGRPFRLLGGGGQNICSVSPVCSDRLFKTFTMKWHTIGALKFPDLS